MCDGTRRSLSKKWGSSYSSLNEKKGAFNIPEKSFISGLYFSPLNVFLVLGGAFSIPIFNCSGKWIAWSSKINLMEDSEGIFLVKHFGGISLPRRKNTFFAPSALIENDKDFDWKIPVCFLWAHEHLTWDVTINPHTRKTSNPGAFQSFEN